MFKDTRGKDRGVFTKLLIKNLGKTIQAKRSYLRSRANIRCSSCASALFAQIPRCGRFGLHPSAAG